MVPPLAQPGRRHRLRELLRPADARWHQAKRYTPDSAQTLHRQYPHATADQRRATVSVAIWQAGWQAAEKPSIGTATGTDEA